MPEMTCWTRSLSQYTAYFAYNNKGKDVSIRVALDNMVNVNGYPYKFAVASLHY